MDEKKALLLDSVGDALRDEYIKALEVLKLKVERDNILLTRAVAWYVTGLNTRRAK